MLKSSITSNISIDSTLLSRVHELRGQLEELSMLRVLAGLGLSIGEFTHEIKQYRPSIYGQIHQLLLMSLPEEAINRVNKIKYNFDNLFVYTDYFRKTITQNLCLPS